MPYTPEKPFTPPSPEDLRERIPGWGADLDPKDRPSFPKERFDLPATGAHWEFPERQEEKWPRERSIEHKFLTPVFGTSCPPKGLSGIMRKYAYKRFSEARAAHWLILMGADRIDALESHVGSLLSGKPDNVVKETGIASEFSHHGLRSRLGVKRIDVKHVPLDPFIVAAPWVAAGGAVVAGVRRLIRNR